MEETILFPSPNWFLVSNLAVSKDGWLIYGGPSKSLCVLEPHGSNVELVVTGNQGYKAHVVPRAHFEKIVSVDISQDWPDKRLILSGGADGIVKQWMIETIDKKIKIKSTHSHEIHHNEKEEVIGVGYSSNTNAITVGSFGNVVKWDLNANVVKTYNHFLRNFKPTCMSCSHHLPLNVAVGTKQGVIFVLDLNGNGNIVYKVRGQDDDIMNINWCPQYDVTVKKKLAEFEKHSYLADRLDAIRNEAEKDDVLDASGVSKKLPEDSFDEPVVPDDDMFDIYKDHEADEFGHKKYQPEEILVKVKEEIPNETDYLAECMRLKDQILKRKNDGEDSIESLVQAMDNTHVQSTSCTQHEKVPEKEQMKKAESESSDHAHKHLLATIGKHSGVRIWSKTGKLIASCGVPNCGKNPAPKGKAPNWPTLLWYKPDVLLIADGKSQLLECNPLKIDCKNKMEWRVVHSFHKRGFYCIVSSAPRVQTDVHTSQHWPVYTTSQERNIVVYCMQTRAKLATYATCGGFLYTVQVCPYDAGKVAVSVGDGAVRVWETSTLADDDTKLSAGDVHTYWQNVQGKVLTLAWHPTKENLLAFGTAEARVGLIDTSGKTEKVAKVLLPAVSGGVYSLCWGEGNELFASGGGDLVKYSTNKPDEAAEPVSVVVEGGKWPICSVQYSPRGLLCGSGTGAIALLSHDHQTLAAAFVFTKTIHAMEWHPQQTSGSNEESPHKNLIAVCSSGKENTIVILEYGDKEDGSKQLSEWKTLSGHKGAVLQLVWNPHQDGQLMSTSQDYTVRIWEIEPGACTHVFSAHCGAALSAAWDARPQLAHRVLSGGADCCLRLWDVRDHLALLYVDTKPEAVLKKKRHRKGVKKNEGTPDTAIEDEEQVAITSEAKIKASKKYLLPITAKQMIPCTAQALRKVMEKYIEKNVENNMENASVNGARKGSGDTEFDMDYLKMFGSMNDVNELLDKELERHLELERFDGWIMLSIFRGYIDSMIQFANQMDMLCPFLVSLAPCVSFKYWKDATQLYVAQIDRLVGKGEEEKLYEKRLYGGAAYRKAATLLSVHDVKGAVAALTDMHLYKEAYILCRIRHMDSIAQDTLWKWAKHCSVSGLAHIGALCYIVLGELPQAASMLAKSSDQEYLSLAADLAKVAGQTTFAEHVAKKALTIQNQSADNTQDLLEKLPSRIELLMKDNKTENGEAENVGCDNVKDINCVSNE